jgi:hypothetical protein
MARPPTLFMRIHKTAGESILKQVRDRLPAATVCPTQLEWKVRRFSLAELRKFGFFQGHISPATLTAAYPDLQVFTMLRAPRERLLSAYYYWKERSNDLRGEFFDAVAARSLLEFLRADDPIIRRATWNVQARLIAGGQFGGVDEQRQNVFGPWLSDADLASEAIRALDRFAFVGTTEQYALSLRAVYALLELGDPPLPERVNITKSKPVGYDALLANPEVADALAGLTWADQIVYDAVFRKLDNHGFRPAA